MNIKLIKQLETINLTSSIVAFVFLILFIGLITFPPFVFVGEQYLCKEKFEKFFPNMSLGILYIIGIIFPLTIVFLSPYRFKFKKKQGDYLHYRDKYKRLFKTLLKYHLLIFIFTVCIKSFRQYRVFECVIFYCFFPIGVYYYFLG